MVALFAPLAAVAALAAPAGDEAWAITCARVIPMDEHDSIHTPGLVLLRDGVIEYAGPPREVSADYQRAEFPDAWAVPGMIDLHSHVQTGGWGDINDMVLPVNPELRTSPTIVPSNASVRRACAAGVTTLFGIPGSGTSMSGFGVLYKTKTDATYDEVVLADPGGLKIAQTHNPERRGELGQTRAGLYWLLQDVNDAALAARTEGRFDARLESLADVLTRELPVLIHCAGGIGVSNTVRMWGEEYDTLCVLSHGSFTGWKLAAYCAEQGVPVNHGPRTMDFGSSREGRIVGTGAEYWRAGVPNFSLNTDAGVIPQESLPLQGAMTARLGADSYQMLRAVTLHPARSFAIDDRVGSITPGRDADVVLWSGDPLDPRSRVERVWIDGDVQYDRQTDGQWF
jgi:imidazolonepropionase-like amidohydrolase